MKKFLPLILILFTIGCASTQQIAQVSQSTEMMKLTAEPIKTQLLYYWVHPQNPVQMLRVVAGKFYWENGCIYLLQDGKKFTAQFPELPKDSVVWNEQRRTLTLKNANNLSESVEFQMGDVIYTNGYYSAYTAEKIANTDERDRKCLSPDGMANIGTLSIEKL
ncbi:hypothetical protein NKT77_04930 [Moraxella sp. FZLJ2107]|uniref:hypothetical protein n=1 Tax=unclassified Moraxella TaxID=2685852 RepID=UPI00209BFF6A|nr:MULTISPECIES: hypothetical protein [unclassified Moraxella]USZ15267.1 hypothetical protein NGM44_02405 [Moraxella sp. FZFQ2102]UTO05995.1 hypothetical protein NKT77_04930 [Moraxella sp. FZLJ2107]UTO22732.1 hypothetical protein NKU06_01710 [Moraxella sp. FZLJ2109]